MATYSANDPQWVEARLGLVLTDLLISCVTFRAGAAAADKGHRDPVADLPSGHVPANGRDVACQLVAGNVRQPDVRVVAHPAVPIAAADAGGLDLDDDAMGLGRRIGDGGQLPASLRKPRRARLSWCFLLRLGDACWHHDDWFRREAARKTGLGLARLNVSGCTYSEKWRLRTARTISHTPTRTTGTRPDKTSVLSRASISSGVAST